MGMFDRLRKLDSSLQRGIDNGFARVFGGSVVAAELEEALKQEIETSLVYGQAGAIMAPDVLRVSISSDDAAKLEEAQPHISFDLADSLTRYIRNEGWQLYRPLRVDIVPDTSLHSGQLRCNSSHAVTYGPNGEVIRDETANAPAPSRPEGSSSDAPAGAPSAASAAAPTHEAPASASGSADDDAWKTFGGAFASGNPPAGYAAQSPTAGDLSVGVPPAAYPEPPANPMNAASAAAAVSAAAANLAHGVESPSSTAQGQPSAQANDGFANPAAEQAPGQTGGYGNGASAPAPNQSPMQPANGIPGQAPAQSANGIPGQDAAQSATDIPGQGAAQSVGYPAQPPSQPQAQGQQPAPAQPQQQAPAQPPQSPIYDDLANAPTTVHKAPPRPAVTLLLQDGSSRTYHVREGSNVIGRGSAADFRLPDTGVSRKHAEILWDGHEAILVDLKSTNGTTVNDVPIDNWLLADGDIIVMGHSYIEVRINNPGAAS